MEYVIICNSVIRAQMRVGQNDCILSGPVLCEDAENLEIAMGKPIQSFTTTGFNVFGEVIEFSLARYRGDRSRFEVSANI